MGRIAENVAIEPVNYGILRANQTCGIFSDSVKHWLHVCGGVSDNPQNLAGGGLLFQRFHELTVTFLQLFVLCLLALQRFGELLAQLRNRLRLFTRRRFHHRTAQFCPLNFRAIFGRGCHKTQTEAEVAGETRSMTGSGYAIATAPQRLR
jgi:hypothetical protein